VRGFVVAMRIEKGGELGFGGVRFGAGTRPGFRFGIRGTGGQFVERRHQTNTSEGAAGPESGIGKVGNLNLSHSSGLAKLRGIECIQSRGNFMMVI